MFRRALFLAACLGAMAASVTVRAQKPEATPSATLTIKTRMTLQSKDTKLLRKRFYLFKGDRAANKDLIAKVTATPYVSRQCYLAEQHACQQYIDWVAAANCETPYCREITDDDVKKIPEFRDAAKAAGLKIKNKPDIARQWLTAFMPPTIRDGYFRQRRAAIASFKAITNPLAAVMSDPTNGQATFIDIPAAVGDKVIVSNLVPFEIGNKAYLWICELTIKKAVDSFTLPASDVSTTKSVSGCDIIVHDLPKCEGKQCTQ